MPFHSDLSPGLYRRIQYAEYIRFRNRFRHRYQRLYDNTINTNTNTNVSNTTLFTFNYPSPREITFKSVYNNSKIKINKDKETFCPICQSDVETNTEIIRQLKCNHVYHVDCIDKWLLFKNECPLCKFNL